uniref:Uncharacterized protein n=1 Tax=Lygus hesperus TaxID=30085 RepID=A0A0A9Z445_LYGHE
MQTMKRLGTFGRAAKHRRRGSDGNHNDDDDECENDDNDLNGSLSSFAERPASNGGGGGGGTSMTNLSKEQQIHILKERLEAANERILLLRSTNYNSNTKYSSQQSSRKGAVPSSSLQLDPDEDTIRAHLYGKDKTLALRQAGQGRKLRQAIKRYVAKQEAQTLELLDWDVNGQYIP